MKILSSVCLSFVVAVSATSFCLGEEKARDSLPEVLLDRENEFEADVRRLPSEAGDADSDGANMAFAFRTPRLFDGPVTWLVAWDEEEPGAEPWRVIAEDGSIFGVFQPVSDDLALYPEIAKRFPTAKSLQRLRIAREKLDESRRYEAVLTIGDDAKSPLGVSVNAAFGGVGARDADPVRKVVIPEGWIPSPLVMELVEQIRALQGDAAAFDFLLAQLMKKADRWSEFSSLFSKVWDEAQFGTGYTDPVWGSKLNDAAFVSAYRTGHYAQAFSIMQNLGTRLSGAGRFGRLAEVHDIFEAAYRSGGMNMDISSYPDLGPAIPSLPSVRHRKMEIILPFSEPLPGGPPVRTRITKIAHQSGVFLIYGWQKILRGEWREGLEWNVWVRDWASDENGVPIQAKAGAWYGATMNIASILAYRGFDEEALAMIDEAIAAPYGRNYRKHSKIKLAVMQLDMLREAGRPDPEMIPKLRELVEEIENHLHFGKSDHWNVKVDLANALLHEGVYEEGEQLLDEIIAEGSVRARTARLSHWIDIGRTEGVEAELIAVLRSDRDSGHKIFELVLYEMYADFLEKTGRFREALTMRREAIRLARDFDIFDRLPTQLAKLAVLLQALNDEKGRQAAADEALALLRREGIPNSTVTETEKILAKLKSAVVVGVPAKKTAPEVDLQPQRSIVVPLKEASWTTYLTLTNPGTVEQRGRLAISGASARISLDAETDDISIQLGDKAGQTGQAIDLALAPATYRLVAISADPEFAGKHELKMSWIGSNSDESIVRIDEPETGVAGAIIQAGNYQSNPFYGVSVHLNYVTKDRNAASPPLRFRTSQVARVELYQLDGTPLGIDGQGNGSLLNPGDELFGESDGEGNLLLPLTEGQSAFQVIVYPNGPIAEEGLQLDVEVFSGGKWNLHSRNQIAK